MKSTEKFTDKADTYAQFRPSYPNEYIDYLLTEACLGKDGKVADIGSGTGILSRQLLERNLTVVGVEPNDDMRAKAEQSLLQMTQFISVKGTAENTTLEDKSVELVTVAQAFHWFDPEKFKLECRRILKTSGKVALVWNSRDGSSELNKECAEVCRKHCPDFTGFSGGMEESPDALSTFFKDGQFDFKGFPNDLKMDLAGFLGRYLSASYAPKKGEGQYAPFVAALSGLFDKYSRDGVIVVANVTRSYLGEV